MKITALKYILAGCLGTVLTLSAQLHAQVPVIEVRSGDQGLGQSSQSIGASSQSELILLVLSLQEEVRSLRGDLETAQNRLNRIEADVVDRYRDVDRRLSVLMQAAMESDSLPPLSGPSDLAPANTALQEPSAPSSSSAPSVAAEPASANDQNAYDEAFALVRARDFDAAIDAFENFVVRFPEHANTANGYYWLGELHLAKESPDQARVAFETVLDRFPSHHKVPDTLYKLGVTFSRLGEHERSRHMMQRVINEFPQSTAATLAQSFRPVGT
ncbi:tol-pal system protein YbgF [Nitrincola schmidtii]|uniref:tol-pal system protein YbgF n=1 Tax=Nitrincola schmidtii TaxID=1730894 RepID=UPI00124CBAB8|nr:tol-pal system protein YbgF [Nitrincola schmidtii]